MSQRSRATAIFLALLMLLTFLAEPLFAESFRCQKGRILMPQNCRKVQGLQDYLNSPSREAPDWSVEQSGLVRECMMGVRTENLKLKSTSSSWCELADDRAFKILVQIGDTEVREYGQRQAVQASAERVVFEDNQCYGSVCYRIPPGYRKLYQPLRDSAAAAR